MGGWRHAALALLLLAVCFPAIGAEDEDDETVLVTCGSLIKLEHERVRFLLHSHEIAYGYGRGSGQQSVTGFPERDSAGSLWLVRGPENEHCTQGSPVPKGGTVRLQHMETRRWLHSHLFHSPLSNNQEVSCFGADEQSDTGDVWTVEWEDKSANAWTRDLLVRLRHTDTGAFLASHDTKYQRPIPGQSEVFASKAKNANTLWRATEGVYFPQRGAETH